MSSDAVKTRCVDTPDRGVHFSQLAVTAGYRSFPWLSALTGTSVGTGVKGQSRIVQLTTPDDASILYDDGCYIVPHENGTIAVGSSSQKQWSGEQQPDTEQWAFWDRAQALCPALRGAPIIAEWAGVRPRGKSAAPVVGAVPAHEGVWVFTGGFKISLGIAHRAAAALVQQITGTKQTIALPSSFHSKVHFQAAQSA